MVDDGVVVSQWLILINISLHSDRNNFSISSLLLLSIAMSSSLPVRKSHPLVAECLIIGHIGINLGLRHALHHELHPENWLNAQN